MPRAWFFIKKYGKNNKDVFGCCKLYWKIGIKPSIFRGVNSFLKRNDFFIIINWKLEKTSKNDGSSISKWHNNTRREMFYGTNKSDSKKKKNPIEAFYGAVLIIFSNRRNRSNYSDNNNNFFETYVFWNFLITIIIVPYNSTCVH